MRLLRGRVVRQAYKLGYRLLPGLLRPATRGPLVLLYHSVEECYDVWTNRLGHNITPRHFEDHVRYLCANFKVVPFSEVCRGGAAPDEVAITFDDGSASLLTAVLPVVERYRCPIKVYLTLDNLGGNNWLNKLCYLLNRLSRRERENLLTAATGRAAPGRRVGVHDFVHGFDAGRTPAVVEDSFHKHCRGGVRRLYLTEEEARRLAAHPLVEVGSHSRRHYPLPALDAAGLEDEVVTAHRELDRRLDGRVRGFALPFGFREHRTPEVVAAVARVDAFLVTAYGGRLDGQLYGSLPEVRRVSVGGSLGTLWYRLNHPN